MNWYKKTAMPMKTLRDLPEGYRVNARIYNPAAARFEIASDVMQPRILGFIEISKEQYDDNAWCVINVEARHGYGPLLYDVAMEYVTSHGGFLISNAASSEVYDGLDHEESEMVTSDDAQGVWDKYKTRQDVKSYPLDKGYFGYSKPNREYLQHVNVPDRYRKAQLEDVFKDEPRREVVNVDAPRKQAVTLTMYRGMNLDFNKVQNMGGKFVLSPRKSEQGVMWFTHKLIRGHDPLQYVQGRGNVLLTYPVQCWRHIQTTHLSDGSTYDSVPDEILNMTEPTSNCKYYMGYELPDGWMFSYKTEKFAICSVDLYVSPEMIAKNLPAEQLV